MNEQAKVNWYMYKVEMYRIWDNEIEPRWGTEVRYYKGEKDFNDFDLCLMPTRKSVVYLGQVPADYFDKK